MDVHITQIPRVKPNYPEMISGRSLARRNLSAWGRACIADDLVSGDAVLKPSMAQACWLLSVSAASVRRMRKWREEQSRRRSKFQLPEVAQTIPPPAFDIVMAWAAASDAEREIALRRIGVAHVWDRLSSVIG